MTTVAISKDWDWPDLLAQTPGGRGEWDGIRFTLDPVARADYAVVLNKPAAGRGATCPADCRWAVMQEPPDEFHRALHAGNQRCCRVYTQATDLRGARYVHSQGALPWHINRNYDFLTACEPPQKTRRVSWITSAKAKSEGHRRRLRFLDALREKVDLDLPATYNYYRLREPSLTREAFLARAAGSGRLGVEDKWEGLAPYRYSIAVENFSGPYYWSEKLADCFLAWTMPLYYGCSNITDYFPEQSLIAFDIDDPAAVDLIREVVESDLWGERREAIAHARDLVLNRYQLFPFLTREIRAHERQPPGRRAVRRVSCEIRNGLRSAAGRLRRVLR